MNQRKTGQEKPELNIKNHIGEKMEFPIRCFTCGKVIGHLYEEYLEKSKTEDKAKVLDELGVKRYCCRRMFVTYVNLVDEVIDYTPMK